MLGLPADYTPFDPELITYINTAIASLFHLGVGSTAFSIKDAEDEWGDWITDLQVLEFVKTCVYLKTRLLFDPPASSTILEANKACIDELEWRIASLVDWEKLPADNERDLWVEYDEEFELWRDEHE